MFDNNELSKDEIIESLRNIGIVAERCESEIIFGEAFVTGCAPILADSQICDPTSHTLEVVGCDKIILKNKTLDFVFEIEQPQIEEFEKIIINGITFVREENNEE